MPVVYASAMDSNGAYAVSTVSGKDWAQLAADYNRTTRIQWKMLFPTISDADPGELQPHRTVNPNPNPNPRLRYLRKHESNIDPVRCHFFYLRAS